MRAPPLLTVALLLAGPARASADRRSAAAESGMVTVPAGRFLHGCNAARDERCKGDERPSRRIYLGRFAIDRTEVTVGDYRRCVAAGACKPPAVGTSDCPEDVATWRAKRHRDRLPVTCVTWFQARDYCKWRGARLPSEAEWEKAARGKDGRVFPWGDRVPGPKSPLYGNFGDAALERYMEAYPTIAGYDDRFSHAAPVGSFPAGASPYGVLDAAGNVGEWVADWYDSGYYRKIPRRNPSGPKKGNMRAIRGGSFIYNHEHLRVSNRGSYRPGHPSYRVGFRCAK